MISDISRMRPCYSISHDIAIPYRIICFGIVNTMNPTDFLRELMRRSGDNPNSLAVKLNNRTRQPQIYKFLEGISKEPKRATIEPVAAFYKVNVEAFYNPEIADKEIARLDGAHGIANVVLPPGQLNASASASFPVIQKVTFKSSSSFKGYATEPTDNEGVPLFDTAWYEKRNLKPEKIFAVTVRGHGMAPTLRSRDLVFVNTEQAEPKDTKIFLVAYEGEFVFKRLVRDDGQWWLASDNPDKKLHPRKTYNVEHTKIIGEVVYLQTEDVY